MFGRLGYTGDQNWTICYTFSFISFTFIPQSLKTLFNQSPEVALYQQLHMEAT